MMMILLLLLNIHERETAGEGILNPLVQAANWLRRYLLHPQFLAHCLEGTQFLYSQALQANNCSNVIVSFFLFRWNYDTCSCILLPHCLEKTSKLGIGFPKKPYHFYKKLIGEYIPSIKRSAHVSLL